MEKSCAQSVSHCRNQNGSGSTGSPGVVAQDNSSLSASSREKQGFQNPKNVNDLECVLKAVL